MQTHWSTDIAYYKPSEHEPRLATCRRCPSTVPAGVGICTPCQHSQFKADEKLTKAVQKYGLTAAGFRKLLAEQGGGCAICGATAANANGGRLVVDHDHETGKVRGLLCGGCNTGIGLLGDDAQRVLAAAWYLDNSL